MKKFLLFYLFLLPSVSFAQSTLSGYVTDQQSGKSLPGATVFMDGTFLGTNSDSEGKYELSKIKNGTYTLRCRLIGYREYTTMIRIAGDSVLSIQLSASPVLQDEVIISATRAGEKSAMAVSELDENQIQQSNTARDIPYLLESVPSLIATSDAGTGTGYTGVRIRGSDATRINVTINGIPVNDSESQLVYWVNMPDLSGSVENIQVQRGVGTSTNGAGAFGGSINILTSKPSDSAYAIATCSYGTFNTWKNSIRTGTGLINGKWNFEGRLSKISSDGFVDRASSDLKSFYISGGYYGKNDILKVNIFSGKEITYQSWFGVPEAALDTNRSWNYYTYDNQVDNYQQDHYQVIYSKQLTPLILLNSALHFTHGEGYYEEFKEGEALSDYGLADVGPVTTTDLIRRKWLDNNFYGGTFSFNYTPDNNISIIAGGGWNQYDGDHFGEVIWARFSSTANIRHRYYDDGALKTDFNSYVKATIGLGKSLSLFGDIQYRSVSYNFTGFDASLNVMPLSDRMDFINPKAGITYTFRTGTFAYASLSIGNKEPSRDDYTSSTPASRPQPERLYDIEFGYRHRMEKISAGINFYSMIYDNQLVLTGKINDVGNYTRTNIKNSSRNGVELDAVADITAFLSARGNLTFSKNKISVFREFIYDENELQKVILHKNTDIAFSPAVTGFAEVSARPGKNLIISIAGKYVGKQYLDNTTDNRRSLDPYTTMDARASYTFKTKLIKEIRLSLFAQNILDEKYESNGYTFSYIYNNEIITENYYYPQAGRNFLIEMKLSF